MRQKQKYDSFIIIIIYAIIKVRSLSKKYMDQIMNVQFNGINIFQLKFSL